MCVYTKMRRMCVLSVRCGGAGVTAGTLLYPGTVCVCVALRVVSVPGTAMSCRWSLVLVLDGRRCPSPMWRSVLMLVAAVVLLMVMVVVQLLVLEHSVVITTVVRVVVVVVVVTVVVVVEVMAGAGVVVEVVIVVWWWW